MLQLPKALIDQVRAGRAVLFLGAGASRGATHPKGNACPNARELGQMIAAEFLDATFEGRPLGQIADLAMSERDFVTVQSFIRDIFIDFQPAPFHLLIPSFAWAAIATTNYDLIVERAYERVPNSAQKVVPFRKDGEKIEDRLRAGDVPLLKLHGCITDVNDDKTRLILTQDQYVTHRHGRKRLFARLADAASEYPVVFVGHSLEDVDLRAVLLELDELGGARPRSYLVAPNITSADQRYWEGRRVTCIDSDFATFLASLDASMPRASRALSAAASVEHPIAKHLKLRRGEPMPDSLSLLLENDVEFVHSEIPINALKPEAFYKGYFTDWSPILGNLDVRRGFADNVISEIVLPEEAERGAQQELVVVKGSAGSGKTVALKRIAWEAGIQYDKLCLVSRTTFGAEYEALSELYRLSGKRIYLFVDGAGDHVSRLGRILQRAQKDRIPLTIVAAERFTDWNVHCEDLERYVTATYEVPYLSEREIRQLLALLTQHNSLGHLANKTIDQQIEDLSKRSGRQLLVALHEATFGKPFEEIVLSEYNRISNADAKNLYLTVCVLHRLGVPVRAGVISRVHKIPFHRFREELFRPLESVVFARERSYQDDIVYESRHPHVAEIVFETVLGDVDSRFDQYARLLNALDVDYRTDRDALFALMNARRLESLFPDINQSRALFRIVDSVCPEEAMLLQQEAILEMRSDSGSLDKSAALLDRAHRLAPRNVAIAHSLAELSLRRSERAVTPLERARERQKARQLSLQLMSDDPGFSHPYHTLLKVELAEFEEALNSNSEHDIEMRVKQIEKLLDGALQRFPEQEFLLHAESQFRGLLKNRQAAMAALLRAFESNRRSSYIAVRLAKSYEAEGRLDDAVKVLRECLENNPHDKSVNFRLAMILIDRGTPGCEADIKHCLRKSFTRGDNRFAAQFWYARLLFLEGDMEGARQIFDDLSAARVSSVVRAQARGLVLDVDGRPQRFAGVVTRKEASYIFVRSDDSSARVFAPCAGSDIRKWSQISTLMRVTFELAFNYRGAVALNISSERDSNRPGVVPLTQGGRARSLTL